MNKVIYTFATIFTFALASFAAPKPATTANDYFQVGFDAANLGNHKVAIQNFNIAIGLEPTRIYFYYHRGIANRNAGNKSASIADFNTCNSIRPIAEAYYQLGVFKYEESNLLGAKKEFEKAIELKEDVEKVNYYLGIINYRIGDFNASLACLNRYTTLVKTNPDAFLFLALSHIKLKNFNEARPCLKSALLYTNNDWKLYYKMYEIYREMGDINNQLYNLSMVIELGQRKSEFYTLRSKLYESIGDRERAEEDFYFSQNIAEAK